MLTTDDYLKLAPWDALLEIINHRYQLELDTARTRLLAFNPVLGSTQTSVTLETKRSTDSGNLLPAMSQRTFQYERLDLTTYFGVAPIPISDIRPPVSSYTLVKRLQQQTGIVFSENDFVNEIIYSEVELADYELVAHPRSLRWVGSLRFAGTFTKSALSGIVTTSLPNVIPFSQSNVNKIEGPHYLMGYDFSEFRREFLPIQVGLRTVSPKRMAAILRQVTTLGEEWRCSEGLHDWNISTETMSGEATYGVVYNGPVNMNWSPRSDMRYVLVLGLNEDRCNNIGGRLLLHYK